MLIEHYQHLEKHEGESFGPNLVLRGARERISPIMMTALTTALAILPLVVAGNLPGHEIEHPLAVVVLGGLITSTLLNLFVVPSLYLHFAKADVEPGSGDSGPVSNASSFRAAERADRVEKRIAEIRRLLRTDAVDLVQVVDRFRPPLHHVPQRRVVKDDVRRNAALAREPQSHVTQDIEQVPVDVSWRDGSVNR